METSKETSSNLIRKYQRYLKLEKGYSPNTLDAYIRDVDKLLKFLSDEEKTPQEAKLEDIENFAAAVCDLGIGARSLARIWRQTLPNCSNRQNSRNICQKCFRRQR